MSLARNLRLPLAALALSAGCGPKAPPARGPDKVPVTVATVESRELPIVVKSIGHVEAYARVEVKTRVGGIVKRVAFSEGQDVKAGDLLFAIDPGPLDAAVAQAQANLERDQARAKNAAEVSERYAGLVEKEYVTREQYGEAQTNAEWAAKTVQVEEAALADARLQRGYCDVTAPIAGRTGSLLIHAGNVVKANDDRSLVVINQVEPILVSFSVPESYLARVKQKSERSALKVEVSTQDLPGETQEGELSFIDNTVDRATGTIGLKATFPNRDRKLWPGQFVDAALTLGTEPGALVVPSAAVQTGQNGDYVFVVKTDLKAESRPVSVARVQDQMAVIARGLTAGERVVTDGQLRLGPGTEVEVKGSGTDAPEKAAATRPESKEASREVTRP